MKKKFTKRLLSWVMAAAMVISMLPISAMATGTGSDYVAQIGDTQYATLDEAVADAADGATIELLADATTKGWQQSKNLTIKAAEGLTQKPKITFDTEGLALWGVALEFENIDVVMNGIGATPYGEWKWMAICASKDASLTLDNVNMTMDATGASGSPHAIYFCQNNVLNVLNGSNLTIKNYANDALEWDGGNGGYNVNITDSTFVSDHNRSGFTGTFYATITNSDVDVINSTGNGSNGSNFIIDNSNVNFSDNGGHGLSAGNLTIKNRSIVNGNNNAYYGVVVGGTMTMDGTSSLTANENGSGYIGGGFCVNQTRDSKTYNITSRGTAHIDSGAQLTLKDNERHGLLNFGTFTADEGSKITITGNSMNKTSSNPDKDYVGGGVYNHDGTMVLPSDAVIYNNHAQNGGDDIYNYDDTAEKASSGRYPDATGYENVPTIQLGKVGSDWVLDDCDHYINGWYEDGANLGEGNRWAADIEPTYIVLVDKFGDENLMTISGDAALKAAHGKDPVDKTSYPGLDKQISDANEPEWSNDDVDAAAGQDVNFKLISNVPDDLLNYIIPDVDEPEVVTPAAANALVPVKDRGEYHLTFHDMMNDMLVDATEPVVTLDRPDGQEDVTLTAGTQYVYTTETDDGCDFHIVIDLVALYDDGIITDDDIENATDIVVTYSAKLSGEAIAGTYENEAWTTVDENDWKSSPDTVYVNTYKLSIFKYDQAIGNKPEGGLGGAEFTLTKRNDEAFGTKNLTSGPNGTVSLDGLDAGTYILTETKAPDGYVCNSDPQTIVIDEDHNTIAYVVTVNFANAPIPHTGGMGTTMFSIVGGALIATAGVIFVISRKKRARNAA